MCIRDRPLAAQPAKDDAKSPDAAQQILITVERETPQGWQVIDLSLIHI